MNIFNILPNKKLQVELCLYEWIQGGGGGGTKILFRYLRFKALVEISNNYGDWRFDTSDNLQTITAIIQLQKVFSFCFFETMAE